jgi:hypothetical protein
MYVGVTKPHLVWTELSEELLDNDLFMNQNLVNYRPSCLSFELNS